MIYVHMYIYLYIYININIYIYIYADRGGRAVGRGFGSRGAAGPRRIMCATITTNKCLHQLFRIPYTSF